MATDAQIAANRRNAYRSTGPRTHDGKARASRNHTIHGLCSNEFVVQPGEEDLFDAFIADLRLAIQPHGALEFDLFSQLAHASWTLRRCRRTEVIFQQSPRCENGEPFTSFDLTDKLRNLDIYIRRAERAYHRVLAELKALQSTRIHQAETAAALEIPAPDAPAPLARSEALLPSRLEFAKFTARREGNRKARELASSFAFTLPRLPRALPPGRFERSNPIPPASRPPVPGSDAA